MSKVVEMPLMSRREYGRHRRDCGLSGGTLEAVRKAIASGRISVEPGGRIDSEKADRAWGSNTMGVSNVPPAPARTKDQSSARLSVVASNHAVAPSGAVDLQKRAVLDALRQIAAPAEVIAFARVALRAGCTPLQAYVVARWYSIAPCLALTEIGDEDVNDGFIDLSVSEWRALFGAEFEVEAAERTYDRITEPDLKPAA